jgi:hypothetical protein
LLEGLLRLVEMFSGLEHRKPPRLILHGLRSSLAVSSLRSSGGDLVSVVAASIGNSLGRNPCPDHTMNGSWNACMFGNVGELVTSTVPESHIKIITYDRI